MALVRFTQNIQRHVRCPAVEVSGGTLREVLDAVFAELPAARPYVVDEQGALRQHMTLFVDGVPVRDRATLADPVGATSKVDVMQALSGG